jgi:PAS domain S-box-containing protein
MKRPGHSILLITLFYAFGASLWILFSDLLIGYFIDDPGALVIASTIKGWGFVCITSLLLYAVLLRVSARGSAVDTLETGSAHRHERALYWYVFVAIALIILAGVVTVDDLVDRHEAQNTARLQSIARLKADQISRWLGERAHDVELIRTQSSLGDDLHHWRTHGDAASLEIARKRLQALQAKVGYQGISVMDRSGSYVLLADKHNQNAPVLQRAIERAFTSGKVEFTDLYQDEIVGEQHTHFDFVATLSQAPEFVMISRLTQHEFLFPFLQQQTLPSASTESLLFMPAGDSVLFLNELRFRNNTALKLRVPYSDADVLAVQLATGRVAPGEPIVGIDYRGEAVIGVAQAVKGTGWYLITKIDRKEELASLQTELFWVGLAFFLGLLSVVGAALLHRQRRELHAATALQRDQAEASLDIVFQALPDLYFRLAADGTILDYRARRLSDLYIPPEKFVGNRMQDVLPSSVGELLSSNMKTALETGEMIEFEYEMTMPTGKQFFEARLARLSGKNELIAIVRNIDERRRILRNLDVSNRLYATLSQINQAIVRQHDSHVLFKEICDIAIDFGGFTLAWIGLVDDEGKVVRPVAFSGQHDGYLRNINISLEGDPNSFGPTGRAIRQGHSVVFNDLEHNPGYRPWREQAMKTGYRSSGAFPIRRDNRIIGALNVYAAEPEYFDSDQIGLLEEAALDISFALEKLDQEQTRMQAEQALRASETRLRTLIDSMPDLVWLKDVNGVFLFCNPRFEQLFGVKEAEIVGRTDYDFVDSELADFFREKDRAAMAADGPSVNEEEITFANDGHIELVETVKTPMFGHDGVLIGILGTARDITERKHHEAYMVHQANRADALLQLPRKAEELDQAGFLQYGLELAEDLTGSNISFLHFVNEDEASIELVSWSRRTIEHYCDVVHDTHYPVKDAGIWADALRRRAPVVFNDYADYADKRGLPEGHAELNRLISVPVIENGKVVLLAGVGNKASDYTELEVETMRLVSNEIWNVVQRRRFITTLGAKEARYRELVDNMSAGVAVYEAVDDGRDFIFRDHNTAGLRINKMTREQTIGQRVTELFPGIVDMGLLDVFRRVWQTGQPESCPSHKYQDQHLILWLDNYVFKLPSGELVTVYEDITERKRAEAALHESESRLRTLINTMPDLVWLKDPDGVYLACNPKFERMYGASEADIVGKTDYDFTDEAQATFFREHDRAAMEAGKPTMNEEQLTFADDGHTELVETIKTPMYNSDGALIGVLGIGRDITEHIRAETRLAAQLEELQRWRDVTLERELRGLELKSEINALLRELDRSPRYPSALQESKRDE